MSNQPAMNAVCNYKAKNGPQVVVHLGGCAHLNARSLDEVAGSVSAGFMTPEQFATECYEVVSGLRDDGENYGGWTWRFAPCLKKAV